MNHHHYYVICLSDKGYQQFSGDFVAAFRWFCRMPGLCRLYGVDWRGTILLQERYNEQYK